jgi:hypothetical protein
MIKITRHRQEASFHRQTDENVKSKVETENRCNGWDWMKVTKVILVQINTLLNYVGY